jgi:hypothetical protein
LPCRSARAFIITKKTGTKISTFKRLWKPSASARSRRPCSRAPLDGIEIPGSAVVWWTGRAWVLLRTDTDTFTRHEIPTDVPAPGGGFIVPVQRLPHPVSELVAQGAQVLLSEEFRAQIEVGEDKKK